MSKIQNVKAPYDLAMKLRTKDERLAKIRQRQRRERKEELYSFPSKSRKNNS
jgi:hypothetical protein